MLTTLSRGRKSGRWSNIRKIIPSSSKSPNLSTMVGYDPTAKSVTLPPSSATSPSIHASTTTTSSKSSSSSDSSDSPGERPHPHQRHFVVAGFSSGCMTRFLCHPLDVLKIRFQLQIEPISRASSVSKYRTVSQTFSCIVREESMAALWKGHVSAQILSGIYGKFLFWENRK